MKAMFKILLLLLVSVQCFAQTQSNAMFYRTSGGGTGGGIPVYEGKGTPLVSTSTSFSVPYPSGIQSGDILVLYIVTGGILNAISSLENFDTANELTPIIRHSSSISANFIIWRRADGTESGSEDVTITVSPGCVLATIYRFSGCLGSGDPFSDNVESRTVQETDYTLSSLSSTYDNGLGLCFISEEDNSTLTLSGTDWVELENFNTSTGTDCSLGLASYDITTAGSVNNVTWSWGTAEGYRMFYTVLRSE